MPSPSPKRDTNLKKVIYVHPVKIPVIFHISDILKSWNRTKFTKFVLINTNCPVSAICVTLRMKDLPKAYDVGETEFGWTIEDSEIHFDVSVTSEKLAQATACHELGHFLGLGHVVGTRKSCMPKEYIYGSDDPIRPTKLDIHWADSLGPWNLDRMYVSSQKTVDIGDLPK